MSTKTQIPWTLALLAMTGCWANGKCGFRDSEQQLYPDNDGDGYGDGSSAGRYGCEIDGYALPGDCDDEDDTIHPDATDPCDGVTDANCDGTITEARAWYPDEDGDGAGDQDADPVVACEAPAGAIADSSDCDDQNGAILADAAELCNGVDDDCDGAVDDQDSDVQGTLWYADRDADGYGDPDGALVACFRPLGTGSARDPLGGWVPKAGDPDDADDTVRPPLLGWSPKRVEDLPSEAAWEPDADLIGRHPPQMQPWETPWADDLDWVVWDELTTGRDEETSDDGWGHYVLEYRPVFLSDLADATVATSVADRYEDLHRDDFMLALCTGETTYPDSDNDGDYASGWTCEDDLPAGFLDWRTTPGGDCDDSNPEIQSGATESCDSGTELKDLDCDDHERCGDADCVGLGVCTCMSDPDQVLPDGVGSKVAITHDYAAWTAEWDDCYTLNVRDATQPSQLSMLGNTCDGDDDSATEVVDAWSAPRFARVETYETKVIHLEPSDSTADAESDWTLSIGDLDIETWAPVDAGSVQYTWTGEIRESSDLYASSCAHIARPTIWVAFQAPTHCEWRFDTQGSAIDTILSTVDRNDDDDDECNALIETGCDDDSTLYTSLLTHEVSDNQTLLLAISGYSGAVGEVELHAACR